MDTDQEDSRFNTYSNIIKKRKEKEKTDLTSVIRDSVEHNAEENAKIIDLSEKSGLPNQIVNGISDKVEKQVKQEQINNLDISKKAPKLANQLKTNPEFARATQDNLPELAKTENTILSILRALNPNPFEFARQAKSGYLQSTVINELQQKNMLQGSLSDDEKAILKEAREEVAGYGVPNSVFGFLGNLAGIMLPMGTKATKYGVVGAGVGASIGAGTGGAAGVIGGAAGIAVGGTTGALIGGRAGLSVGLSAGFAYENAMFYAGSVYEDQIQKGVDPEVARNVALTTGGIMGLLESVLAGKIVKSVSGNVVNKLADITAKKMNDPVQKYTISNLFKQAGLLEAEQLAITQTQSTVQLTGNEVALALSGKEPNISTEQGRKELVDEWLEHLKFNAGMTGSVTLASTLANTRHLNKVINTSTKEANSISDFKLLAGQSETKNKSPAVFKKFLENQLSDGNASKIYIRGSAFRDLLDKHGITAEDLGINIVEDLGENSVDLGGDVVISNADYLAKIVDSPFGNDLMEHVRLEQDSMSLAEINELNELNRQREDTNTETTPEQSQELVPVKIDTNTETNFPTFLETAKNKFFENNSALTDNLDLDFLADYEKYLYDTSSVNQNSIPLYRDFTRFLLEAYKDNKEKIPLKIQEKIDRIKSVYEAIENKELELFIPDSEQQGASNNERQGTSNYIDLKNLAEYKKLRQEAKDLAIEKILNQSFKKFTWLNKAMSKEGRKIVKNNKKLEKEQRKVEVKKANNKKIYRVINVLRYGVVNENGTRTPYKIAIDSINELFEHDPEKLELVRQLLGEGVTGMLARKGVDVYEVAQLAGYKTSNALIKALLEAKDFNLYVDEKTQEAVTKKSEHLSTNEAVETAINIALNNDARVKFNAIELKALAKIDNPASDLIDKAYYVSIDTLNATKVGSLNINKYAKTLANLHRDAYRASLKGDLEALIDAKQKILLLTMMSKQAGIIQKKIDAFLSTKKRFFDSDKKISRRRNIDTINEARNTLAVLDLDNKNKLASDKFKALTTKQALDLIDTINASWNLARQEQTIIHKEEKKELQDVVDDLIKSAKEFKTEKKPKDVSELRENFSDYVDTHIRAEYFAKVVDGGNHGLFHQFITDPIFDSVAKYKLQKQAVLTPLVKSLEALKIKRNPLEAPELATDYVFKDLYEILGALLYTGNKDALNKMIAGKHWGEVGDKGVVDLSRWNAFLDRAFENGIIEKKHMDWVQSVWDTFNNLLPETQATFKYLNGYEFKEIIPLEIKTPFGNYKGGYSPIKYVDAVHARRKRAEKLSDFRDELNTGLNDFNDAMPFSKTPSFTQERTGFVGEVSFDLQNVMSEFDKVVKFINIAPRAFDIHKILSNDAFIGAFDELHPNDIDGIIAPWLSRSVKQTVVTKDMPAFTSGVLNHIKASSSLSFLSANIGNTLEQITNLIIASKYVNKRNIGSTAIKYASNGRAELKDRMFNLSDFMKVRASDNSRQLMMEFKDLYLPASNRVYQAGRKLKDFFKKNGLFMQHYFQNEVDIVIWSAAFDEVFAKNAQSMPEAKAQMLAVNEADKIVRLALESFSAESSAKYQEGNMLHQNIVMFSGFFNNLANHIYSETAITTEINKRERLIEDNSSESNNDPKSAYDFVKDTTRKKTRELKRLARYFAPFVSFYLVITLGDMINRKWRTGDAFAKDKEGNDNYFDTFALPTILGGMRTTGAFGNVLQGFYNYFTGKQNITGKLTSFPATSAVEQASKGVKSLLDFDKDMTTTDWKNISRFADLATGVPITSQAVKPYVYLRDVKDGKIDGGGFLETMRGVMTGAGTPKPKKPTRKTISQLKDERKRGKN